MAGLPAAQRWMRFLLQELYLCISHLLIEVE